MGRRVEDDRGLCSFRTYKQQRILNVYLIIFEILNDGTIIFCGDLKQITPETDYAISLTRDLNHAVFKRK